MPALDGHQFWIDDVPWVTDGFGAATLVLSHRDVTDAHLLALAEARGGALVTLDTRMTRLLGDRDPGLMVVPA